VPEPWQAPGVAGTVISGLAFFEEKGLRFPLETATARYTYVALVMDANSELAASFLPGSEDCTKVEEIPPGEPGDN
jgi:hypothetical protein